MCLANAEFLDHPAQERFALKLPFSQNGEGAVECRSLLRAFRLSRLCQFTQNSAQPETTVFDERAESRDSMARLTVYVLNAAVLIMAFPVGFGLLMFNILGGENLRTTAHVLALTGLGTALVMAGYAGDMFTGF